MNGVTTLSHNKTEDRKRQLEGHWLLWARVGAYTVSSAEDAWLGSLVCSALPSPLRARDSDVQSSEGPHQGDLSVLVCFTSAWVSAAVSVLQGFEAVPLLLTFLLLQPLLFPPLLVCDLE